MKIYLKVRVMIRLFLSLLILLNYSELFSQETVVKGEISGLSNDTLSYHFRGRDANNKFVIMNDIVVANDGAFYLELAIECPGVLRITPIENMRYSPAGGYRISYESDYITILLTSKRKYTIKAHLEDGVVDFYTKGDKINKIFSEENSLRKEMHINRAIGFKLRKQAKTEEEREKASNLLKTVLINESKLDFIKHNANSPISAYYLTEMPYLMNEKNIDEYVAMLGEKALNSFLGKDFLMLVNMIKDRPIQRKKNEERKKKQTAMNGKQAPDFSLKDIDGNTFTLSQMKGKYMLIYFWFSGCGGCIESFAELERYNEKYKDRMNVAALFFSDTYDEWKQAIEKHKITNWINIIDDKDKVAKMYYVQSAPHYVLISPEGVVIQRIDRLTDLDKILNSKIIELPLIQKDGYGPFSPASRGISPYSKSGSWKGTQLKVKGVPADWKNAKVGDITMNMHQKVYQNVLAGNLSEEFYKTIQDGWNWTPDTLKLSKTPIKASVAFVCEKDSAGDYRMIIDANNNLDFSDDKVFFPTTNRSSDSIAKEKQIMISYEEFLNNEVVTVNVPVFISHMKVYDILMCNFPRYVVVNFKGKEFAISSNDFTNQSYDKISIVMLNDSLKHGKKASREEYITEYIKIDGEIYKNKGVDLGKDVLVLEKVNTPEDQIFSTQIGFKSPLFKGEDFLSKDSIALENFRGKYVYIDFWSLGCAPCIAELPHLKELYGTIDKSQFEFLGIVSSMGGDDAIKKMMDKHSVSWSHIMSNKENNIEKLYGVNSYPTTLLLDKEGRIIAKNLRGKELADKIKELMK